MWRGRHGVNDVIMMSLIQRHACSAWEIISTSVANWRCVEAHEIHGGASWTSRGMCRRATSRKEAKFMGFSQDRP